MKNLAKYDVALVRRNCAIGLADHAALALRRSFENGADVEALAERAVKARELRVRADEASEAFDRIEREIFG